jgi:lipopolysaccharide export system protein LptA
MFTWTYLLLLSGVLLGPVLGSQAVDAAEAKRGESAAVTTTITSKKMTVRNQDGQAVFEGSVVLTKGTLTVYSDKMVVSFHSSGNDGAKSSADDRTGREATKNAAPAKGADVMPAVSNRSVSRIEATGHVKIEKENGNATCQKAVYFSDDEKIILTGDPVAWEKGTRVSGRQITMYLAEDRSVVEGGSHVRIEGEGSAAP